MYYDPPYRPLNKTSSFNSYAKDQFGDDEQIRLSKMYRQLDKKGVLQLLSNSDPKNHSDDSFFDDLYKGFNINRVAAKRAINSNPEKRGNLTELLIRNY
jgi:DNA adenine methylase